MTDPWGVIDGYEDTSGQWQTTPERTRARLHAAMGIDGRDRPAPPAVRVLRPQDSSALDAPARLTLEDGTPFAVERALPADLPHGYHTIEPRGGAPITLIVTPGRCPLPNGLRAWGWAAQLYAARSQASWGIGDLADLARLGRWSAGVGAELVLVNPLGAPMPRADQQPSPYFPSSRLFLNPLYLRVEDVPGARERVPDLDRLASAGRALNAERVIDRSAVFQLKMRALEALWRAGAEHDDAARYRRERGRPLDTFATFCALAEQHPGDWRRWPAEYRRADTPGVARFAAEHADRIGFHAWLQSLLDAQLARATTQVRVMQDLPIGVDPGGADAWAWQDTLCTAASIGAPADLYNRRGQDWGLPPFVPHRLRAARYAPFVETIRAALRHAGGLRIDHVMGLFRLYWVPHGSPPTDGAYVRYPADDLLAIVALETERAGAIAVGEDLGTVEPGARERLAEHRVLSYRVVWFEDRPPEEYPALAMAAVTTHDLPTVRGVWSGADLAELKALALDPDDDAMARLREALATFAGVADDADVEEVVLAVHARLGHAPSVLVTATLDDALAVAERPNVPGTTSERPNWSLALPAPLEELERASLPRRLADTLAAERPRGPRRSAVASTP